ncbi:Site-specific recombinase XerD [Actinopolyspora alba]|uniref:Site-specific recombinase XerD n=1 Tax=Actinopolyspora alba TaxID=673379 RepID=A0A1I1ZHC4_9ACTN|nr:site-specific integrase [Actinopolyspora alba]SFE29963.1 Site-specific recombinase XerD [Actinopolyspora alba]
MPRPPLPLGTHGEVRCYKVAEKRYRARTKYRDYDGTVRHVERMGTSKTGAKENLKQALRDRARSVAGDEVTAASKVVDVAGMWLRELEESDKALRTKRTYRDAWDRDLSTPVGALRVSEVTVSVATRVLRSIHDNAGSGSAKHAKVVLSGVLAIAVRHDAIPSNPVNEVTLPKASGSRAAKQKTVITRAEYTRLRKHLAASDKALRRDLPDVVDALAALGCRIGELLALDWSKIDLGAGTIKIEGTAIREKGVGLFVQDHTKSSAGMRTVTAPNWFVDLLRRRHESAETEWVFPTASGTLRDPDNTRADLRTVLAGTEWVGLHPHAFRHLVATRLDEAGLSAREIADYLGHDRVSMTQDVYMNRKTVGDSAARALADLHRED